MKFNINHPILFLLAGIIVLAVLGQSLYFLRKAWKRAKEIGMPMDKLKRVAVGTETRSYNENARGRVPSGIFVIIVSAARRRRAFTACAGYPACGVTRR